MANLTPRQLDRSMPIIKMNTNKRLPQSLLEMKRASSCRKFNIGALASPNPAAVRKFLPTRSKTETEPTFRTPQRSSGKELSQSLHDMEQFELMDTSSSRLKDMSNRRRGMMTKHHTCILTGREGVGSPRSRRSLSMDQQDAQTSLRRSVHSKSPGRGRRPTLARRTSIRDRRLSFRSRSQRNLMKVASSHSSRTDKDLEDDDLSVDSFAAEDLDIDLDSSSEDADGANKAAADDISIDTSAVLEGKPVRPRPFLTKEPSKRLMLPARPKPSAMRMVRSSSTGSKSSTGSTDLKKKRMPPKAKSYDSSTSKALVFQQATDKTTEEPKKKSKTQSPPSTPRRSPSTTDRRRKSLGPPPRKVLLDKSSAHSSKGEDKNTKTELVPDLVPQAPSTPRKCLGPPPRRSSLEKTAEQQAPNHRSPRKETWQCSCGYKDSRKHHRFCGMCGASQFWKCHACDNQKNLCVYAFCSTCGEKNHKTNTKNPMPPSQ